MEIRFPLILDGATGTELQKRGYMGDVSAEQWVLEHSRELLNNSKKLCCIRQQRFVFAELRRKQKKA